MSLTITNTTLSNPADKTEVEQNFTDVANKFGAIDNSDVKAGAAIAISKLAASYQEVWLQLEMRQDIDGSWAGTTYYDWVPLPGTDADTAWVATDVSWTCKGVGNGAGTFSVEYGAFSGAGVWVRDGDVVNAATIAAGGGVDTFYQGRALEGGAVTLTQSSTVRALALYSEAAGTNVIDAAKDFLRVTVALRRQITA